MSQNIKSAEPDSAALVAKLLGMIHSSWMSQATCVAAELGIADQLAHGPRKIDDLAKVTGCHAPSLYRLMRALTSLELCREGEDGLFELTPTGALLCADAPNSVRSWTIWWGRYLGPVWSNLLHSVRTGENARKLVTGTGGFGHLEQNTGTAEIFNRAMVELTRMEGRQVIRAYSFSGLNKVVDVGGGYGEMLAAILTAYPELRGVLFDLPHAVEGAGPHLEELGVAGRCELVAGDFFKSIPGGADAYILKNVIHDWDDERSAVILRNCHRAMSRDARLLLVERIMPLRMDTSALHRSMARADLNMLVAHGARERTEAEFRRLLELQGFRVVRIIPVGTDFHVIEAVHG